MSSYNTSLMPTDLVCAQLLWRPSHSSAGSPSLSRIMVVHTKQISPVGQLAGVARASDTASGVALTQTGVPGGFTRSLFVALRFVVFNDIAATCLVFQLPKKPEMEPLQGESTVFYARLHKKAEERATQRRPGPFYSQLQQPPCTVSQSSVPTHLPLSHPFC